MSPANSPEALARALRRGDRRALAQLITAVESRDPKVVPVLRSLYPQTGRARVIGITGPLGVGKSSLINGLVAHVRLLGKKVGVVAVDPSSPFSGGSVLGDRIRIERRPGDEGVFVRSMASRGHAGGLAATTREVVRLLESFGMDIVLVETVGSGQVDVEVREVATTSVVVVVPHLGDEVQTLKAGLFEIADVFCVNKGDLPGAETASKDLSDLVALGGSRDGWRPVVVTTSTRDGTGMAALWTAIDAHETFLDAEGRREAGERRRVAHEIVEIVRGKVERELRLGLDSDPELAKLLDKVAGRDLDPHSAADLLLRQVRKRPRTKAPR